MRKGGVRGPLPQENEGRGRRGVDPSGSRRSRRDRQLAPHPPHRCLLRSRFAVEGRTLRLDSLGLAFFFAGIRRKEEILLKRSAREGGSVVEDGREPGDVDARLLDRQRRCRNSPCPRYADRGEAEASPGRLGYFTHPPTHASPPPQQTTWCCPADGGAVSPTDTPSLLERLRLRLLLRIHTL